MKVRFSNVVVSKGILEYEMICSLGLVHKCTGVTERSEALPGSALACHAMTLAMLDLIHHSAKLGGPGFNSHWFHYVMIGFCLENTIWCDYHMCLAWTSHLSPRAHNSPHTELMTVLAMWKLISGMSYHWLIWILMGSHMCQLYLMSYQGPRLETWWDFICMMIIMMSYHHPIWSLMSSHNFLVTATLRTRSSPTSNSWGFVRLHKNQW